MVMRPPEASRNSTSQVPSGSPTSGGLGLTVAVTPGMPCTLCWISAGLLRGAARRHAERHDVVNTVAAPAEALHREGKADLPRHGGRILRAPRGQTRGVRHR